MTAGLAAAWWGGSGAAWLPTRPHARGLSLLPRKAAKRAAKKVSKGGNAVVEEYISKIQAAGNRGFWKKAVGFLAEMKQKKVAPSSGVYSAVIDALGKKDKWPEALSLLEEAQDPDIMVFVATITAVGESGQWEWAEKLLQRMRDDGPAPDARAYGATMDALGKAGQWQRALDLLEGYEDPDAAMQTIGIRAAGGVGDWETSMSLLRGMDEGDLSAESYQFALQACAEGGAPQLALDLAEEMKQKKLKLDTKTFGKILKECEKQAAGGAAPAKKMVKAEKGGSSSSFSGPRDGIPGPPYPQMPKKVFVPGDFTQIRDMLKRVPKNSPYTKELNLLRVVLDRATEGDSRSITRTIESYGKERLKISGRWLKIAGDQKAEILTSCIRAARCGGHILEVGAYCGYSATRICTSVPGVRMASLEVDPVHVIIARNVLKWGGLEGTADVWTGHSKDLIPRIEGRYGGPGALQFSAVFFDQKGSLYKRDLDALEHHDLMREGAMLIADNVLKPGAPLFLEKIFLGKDFEAQIISMTEFAMPSEDWMTLNVRPPGVLPPPTTPPPTVDEFDWDNLDELTQLDCEADRMRDRATGPGRSVTFEEWAEFAEKMRTRLAANDIIVTATAPKPPSLTKPGEGRGTPGMGGGMGGMR